MKINFHLYSHERDAIREHLPAGSPASKCLEAATPLDISGEPVIRPEWAVPCEEEDAKLILEVAKKWCPDALPNINVGFKLKR